LVKALNQPSTPVPVRNPGLKMETGATPVPRRLEFIGSEIDLRRLAHLWQDCAVKWKP
jgi:hypothetical protein